MHSKIATPQRGTTVRILKRSTRCGPCREGHSPRWQPHAQRPSSWQPVRRLACEKQFTYTTVTAALFESLLRRRYHSGHQESVTTTLLSITLLSMRHCSLSILTRSINHLYFRAWRAVDIVFIFISLRLTSKWFRYIPATLLRKRFSL